MDDDIKKRFLTNTDETGRFIVKSNTTGKTYFVEPMGNKHSADWGDVDPATKKHTGSYGEKYTGCIDPKESLITKENGFEKIEILPECVSPLSVIYERDKKYEEEIGKSQK